MLMIKADDGARFAEMQAQLDLAEMYQTLSEYAMFLC